MKKVILFVVWAAMGLSIAGCAGIHYIPRDTREFIEKMRADHQAWQDSVDVERKHRSDSIAAVWKARQLSPEMEITYEGLTVNILEYDYNSIPGAEVTIKPLRKKEPLGIMYVGIYWRSSTKTDGLYKLLVLKDGEEVFKERSKPSTLFSVEQSVTGYMYTRWSNIISAPLKPTDSEYEVVIIEGVDDEILKFTISPNHPPKPLTEI